MDIETKVIELLSEQFGVDKAKITTESNFVDDLGSDSLDEVEIAMEVEDTFEIAITDEEAGTCKTVGQLIKLVESKLPA